MLRNYQLSHKPVLTLKNFQMYSCYYRNENDGSKANCVSKTD